MRHEKYNSVFIVSPDVVSHSEMRNDSCHLLYFHNFEPRLHDNCPHLLYLFKNRAIHAMSRKATDQQMK